jgi:hypothetical protein
MWLWMIGNGGRRKAQFFFLPCEDEIIENTIDFHSVSYHRILQNAVVNSVKIATDNAMLKIYLTL